MKPPTMMNSNFTLLHPTNPCALNRPIKLNRVGLTGLRYKRTHAWGEDWAVAVPGEAEGSMAYPCLPFDPTWLTEINNI